MEREREEREAQEEGEEETRSSFDTWFDNGELEEEVTAIEEARDFFQSCVRAMEYCSVLVKRGDEMRTAEKWAALPWWKKLFTTRDRLRRSDPQCSRRNKSKNETAAEFSDRCLETFKDMARRSQQAPDGTKVRISKYLREAGEDWIRLESRFRALEAANRGAPFR